MKAATIHQIKNQLQSVPKEELIALILRLGKFRKENKELISYMLFDSTDESYFVAQIKLELKENFDHLNINHIYLAKKGIRKSLRLIDKNIKFSADPITETELRIYFCELIQRSKIPLFRSRVLLNLYNGQLKKIGIAMNKMHEDAQFDFLERLSAIS